jgi:hypothetical protein
VPCGRRSAGVPAADAPQRGGGAGQLQGGTSGKARSIQGMARTAGIGTGCSPVSRAAARPPSSAVDRVHPVVAGIEEQDEPFLLLGRQGHEGAKMGQGAPVPDQARCAALLHEPAHGVLEWRHVAGEQAFQRPQPGGADRRRPALQLVDAGAGEDLGVPEPATVEEAVRKRAMSAAVEMSWPEASVAWATGRLGAGMGQPNQ